MLDLPPVSMADLLHVSTRILARTRTRRRLSLFALRLLMRDGRNARGRGLRLYIGAADTSERATGNGRRHGATG